MKKLYGVTVAMVTPMDRHGKFLKEPMEQLTETLIARGVDCLYPCGTTGEMSHLSLGERKEIASVVVKTARNRVPVYIHAGADTPEKTIELARHARQIGADGVGVVTPAFLHTGSREMRNYYLEVAGALPGDFPVYLYNIPQCSGNDLLCEDVKTIYENAENVAGIKYSYLDLNRTMEYLKVGADFSVLHGCDKVFASLLVLGCQGTVSGVAGVFPEPFVEVYRAYREKDLDGMEQWQKICVEICDILKCGSNMAYFKSGLEFRGIPAGHMRSPQMDLEELEKENLFCILRDFCRKFHISEKLTEN